jgi:hypothetical protein
MLIYKVNRSPQISSLERERERGRDKYDRINYQNGFLICIILIYHLFVGHYGRSVSSNKYNLWDQSAAVEISERKLAIAEHEGINKSSLSPSTSLSLSLDR